MNVPLLLLIFSPLTVKKPWMWTALGSVNRRPWSITAKTACEST